MPKSFEDCVKKGGKVRTIAGANKAFGVTKGKYVRVCFLKGKMFRGEVKTNKTIKALSRG
jgi:hypothetical protein